MDTDPDPALDQQALDADSDTDLPAKMMWLRPDLAPHHGGLLPTNEFLFQ
jgi:hypothetical protein